MEIEIEHRMRDCIDGSYFSENSRMEHLLFSYKFHIFLLKPYAHGAHRSSLGWWLKSWPRTGYTIRLITRDNLIVDSSIYI